MSCKKLKWTKEMEEIKERIKGSLLNKETWNDEVKKVLEYKGFTFFLNIPICVAGGGTGHDAYKAVDKGDSVIQSILPKGYKLVAWYGWGGIGWLAQTKKDAKK